MAPSNVPNQQASRTGSENSDTEGWEVLEIENQPKHAGTTSKPTLSFDFHFKLALGNATESKVSRAPSVSNIPQNPQRKLSVSRNNQDQCQLFRLPAELRLRIYNHLFLINSPTVQRKWHPANNTNIRPSVFSILETCQRINHEAEPIFYTINHLQYPLTTPRPARNFAQTLNPYRRNAIEQLTILATSGADALSTIEEIKPLSKLRKLRIERRQSIRFINVGDWKVLAKQIKNALEEFQELEGLEIVTPETRTPTTPEEDERFERLELVDKMLKRGLR
jgi:hypothetical protein